MKKILIIFFIALPWINILADDGDMNIRVQISASASKNVGKKLFRCAESRLKRIPDVKIVEESPDTRLIIIALDIEKEKGDKESDVAISAVAAEPFNNEDLRFFMDEYSPSALELYDIVTKDLINLQGFWLRFDTELDKACDSIISDFKESVIEQIKQNRQIEKDVITTPTEESENIPPLKWEPVEEEKEWIIPETQPTEQQNQEGEIQD